MLPSVSVPTPNAARLAAIAVPVPELEPQGLRSSAYGFFVCPPRELQPDEDLEERKFAHSLRFVLPRITAPASRSRVTRKASCFGRFSASAREPAELTRPATSTLSLIRTGRPCSGPRSLPALRSASSAAASASARGLSSMTAFRAGPASSTAAMRSRYACVKSPDVSLPSAMSARACVAPSSTTSTRGRDAAGGCGAGPHAAHSIAVTSMRTGPCRWIMAPSSRRQPACPPGWRTRTRWHISRIRQRLCRAAFPEAEANLHRQQACRLRCLRR